MLKMQSTFTLFRRRSPLNAVVVGWHKMVESMLDPYRPELHYMRGPGPRWHAKHQRHHQAGR